MIDPMDMNLSKLQKIVKDRKDWFAAVHGITKSQTQLSNWTTMLIYFPPKSQVEHFLSLDFLGFLSYLTLLVHASTASLMANYFHFLLDPFVSSTFLPLNLLPSCSPGTYDLCCPGLRMLLSDFLAFLFKFLFSTGKGEYISWVNQCVWIRPYSMLMLAVIFLNSFDELI